MWGRGPGQGRDEDAEKGKREKRVMEYDGMTSRVVYKLVVIK